VGYISYAENAKVQLRKRRRITHNTDVCKAIGIGGVAGNKFCKEETNKEDDNKKRG